MKHRIVYSADLHGNEVQYQKLVAYAQQVSADSVIIGGDIAPKELLAEEFIHHQRAFLQERLPRLLEPLKGSSPQSTVYLLMGNDDCSANSDVLEEGDGEFYRLIHEKRLQLTNDFNIVGYSYVPITPFGIKDWEKFDLSIIPEQVRHAYEARKRTNYQFSGYKSTAQGWMPFHFTLEMEESDSLQKDLAKPLFQEKPEKTIYVMHCPPNNPNLDIFGSGGHVGSLAERLFIEERQPYLTLHGHIHETVYMSGTFRDTIGRTVCFSAGNHNVGRRLACLSFDVYDLESAQRIIL
ncbi:MAG: metallophosphoesterase [Nanoarchaeota archaeon]|nr:metallophosphoesterase [Nanoarchaeota archaeon]